MHVLPGMTKEYPYERTDRNCLTSLPPNFPNPGPSRHRCWNMKGILECSGPRRTWKWMTSSRVVRSFDCFCKCSNSPGFNPSILRHGGRSSVDQSAYKSRSKWLLKKCYKSSDIKYYVSSPHRWDTDSWRNQGCRSADPHHFKVDPDPAFHFNADPDPAFKFNADPDPALLQSDRNLRPLVCGPSRALFWAFRLLLWVSAALFAYKLLNSDLNVDPDPASNINSDPDLQPWGAWLPEFETALKGGAMLGAGLLQAGQRVLIPAQ